MNNTKSGSKRKSQQAHIISWPWKLGFFKRKAPSWGYQGGASEVIRDD